ncbi:MAG: alpha-E domain-containing protein [SAR202 cluster bacterium]|nr:MAG: alpha-E domain-containing protein [SAR202 cluster bacterium]
MLSRDAEHFYWLSRYVERAENTARILNVNVELMLDFPGDKSSMWKPLIEITGMEKVFIEKYQEFDEINSVKFLSDDKENPNSILSSLIMAQYNARPIRNNLPRSSAEQLNLILKDFINDMASTKSRSRRTNYIYEVISKSQLFFGIISDNFLRGTEYQFIKLGRFIERADMISRIIDQQCLRDTSTLGENFPTLQWASILRSMSAYESFRMFSQGDISQKEVLNFLIKNKDYGRSISSCLYNVENSINNLPRNTPIKSEIKNLHNRIQKARLEKYSDMKIHDFIDLLQRKLLLIDELIDKSYFHNN